MNGRVLAFLVACMIGLPTVTGPAGAATSPKAIVPTIIEPQLRVQSPLSTQVGKVVPGSLVNPYRVRVYLAANSAPLTNGVTTFVKFDTVDDDPLKLWDPVQFWWVVPLSGRYRLSGNLNVNTTGNNFSLLQLTIFLVQQRGRGGSAVILRSPQHNTVAGTNGASSVPQTGYDSGTIDGIYCLAGDFLYVDAFIFVSPAVNLPLTGGGTGGQYTYFSVDLISR